MLIIGCRHLLIDDSVENLTDYTFTIDRITNSVSIVNNELQSIKLEDFEREYPGVSSAIQNPSLYEIIDSLYSATNGLVWFHISGKY